MAQHQRVIERVIGSRGPLRGALFPLIALIACGTAFLPLSAAAQLRPSKGDAGRQSVIVDLTVLDELGPVTAAPGGSAGRVFLIPPRDDGARRAAARSAKPKRNSKATAKRSPRRKRASKLATARRPAKSSRPPPSKGAPGAAGSAKPVKRVSATPAKLATTAAKPAIAAVSPAGNSFGQGRSFRLAFSPGAASLDPTSRRALDSVAKGIAGDGRLRLQLLAYAGGSAKSASKARRISLSRALSVRSYLIGKGVNSTRIDVRALGNKFKGGPPERVDVIVTKR